MNLFIKISIVSALILAGCASSQGAEPSEVSDAPKESEIQQQELREPDEEVAPEEVEPDEVEPYEEEELLDHHPDEQVSYDASEIYGQICVTCHGETGDGRGLENELFGFDTPAEEWTNGPTVDGILRTLEDGVHDSSMRSFPNFHDVDRVALAEYILDLRAALREE